MDNNKLIPKLRFREFDGEWESCKLHELCKVQDGTHSTPNYVEEGIPFFSVDTIINNVNPKYISKKDHEKLIKRCEPKKGDILLSRITGGILGYPKLVDWDFEFSIYVSLALLSSIKIDSKYLNYYIQSSVYRKDFLSKSLLTASPPKINLNDLESTNIKYPKFYEQKKIANFFFLLNKKIDLLENKYQLYNNFKKYLMQQIFAGKLRFDYEEYALKDVCEQIGNGFSGTQVPYKTSFPVTRIETISSGNINYDKVGFVDEIPERYLLKEGDILLTNINSMKWIGNSVYYDGQEKLYHGMNLMLLRTKNDFNSKYLYYYITYYNNWFKRMACQAVNQASINKSTLEKFIIKFPNIEEQNNISNVLSSSDMKIDQIINEIELTKKFKKGLLQQMFV